MKKFFLLFVLFLLIFGLISCNINFLNPNDSEDNKAVPGTITTHTANTVNFNMVLSPAAKIPIKNTIKKVTKRSKIYKLTFAKNKICLI